MATNILLKLLKIDHIPYINIIYKWNNINNYTRVYTIAIYKIKVTMFSKISTDT